MNYFKVLILISLVCSCSFKRIIILGPTLPTLTTAAGSTLSGGLTLPPNSSITSSYPLNILQLGRSETEMKCMLEFNQTLLGISLDIQAILKLTVNWISSANWAGNSTLGTKILYNSTIYYDSAKSVFYSTMPVSEWSKYINNEVILNKIRALIKKKTNY